MPNNYYPVNRRVTEFGPVRRETKTPTSEDCDRSRPVPAKKSDEPKFKVGDKVRVNLHRGKIEDAVVKAVIKDADGTKLQVDVVGLDLTALVEMWQVVAEVEPR